MQEATAELRDLLLTPSAPQCSTISSERLHKMSQPALPASAKPASAVPSVPSVDACEPGRPGVAAALLLNQTFRYCRLEQVAALVGLCVPHPHGHTTTHLHTHTHTASQARGFVTSFDIRDRRRPDAHPASNFCRHLHWNIPTRCRIVLLVQAPPNAHFEQSSTSLFLQENNKQHNHHLQFKGDTHSVQTLTF